MIAPHMSRWLMVKALYLPPPSLSPSYPVFLVSAVSLNEAEVDSSGNGELKV